MTPDALSRQALRLAARKRKKLGRPLNEEELLRLRIQTVAPWKRILFISIGLSVGALALACYLHATPVWIWMSTGLVAIYVAVAGALGSRSCLDAELRKLQDDAPTTVLNAISNALM